MWGEYMKPPYGLETIKKRLIEIQRELVDVKSCLPYRNNGIEFFTESQYLYKRDGRSYILFGCTIVQFYGLCQQTGEVFVIEEDDILYCNKTIKAFMQCQRLFIEKVMDLIDTRDEIEYENFIKKFMEIDATITEESNWGVCVYELSEQFYPLTDERIKLFETLEAPGDI